MLPWTIIVWMAPRDDSEWMVRADMAILDELNEHRLEYVALIANRRGLHLQYARDRCEVLERQGFIERTTDELTYRITTTGEQYLDETDPASPE